LYGTAAWAKTNDENSSQTDKQWAYMDEINNQEWSIFGKAALFAVVLAAIALWVRISRRRNSRSDVGYEKTLA